MTIVPGKEFKSRWDQGGIAILFPDGDLWEKKRREEENLKKKKKEEEGKGWWGWMRNDNDKAEKHAKYSWIKTGLEWENGGLQLSTVATYAFSDWSLSPVVPSSSKGGGVRFLVERNSSEFFPFLSHYISISPQSLSPPNHLINHPNYSRTMDLQHSQKQPTLSPPRNHLGISRKPRQQQPQEQQENQKENQKEKCGNLGRSLRCQTEL